MLVLRSLRCHCPRNDHRAWFTKQVIDQRDILTARPAKKPKMGTSAANARKRTLATALLRSTSCRTRPNHATARRASDLPLARSTRGVVSRAVNSRDARRVPECKVEITMRLHHLFSKKLTELASIPTKARLTAAPRRALTSRYRATLGAPGTVPSRPVGGHSALLATSHQHAWRVPAPLRLRAAGGVLATALERRYSYSLSSLHTLPFGRQSHKD